MGNEVIAGLVAAHKAREEFLGKPKEFLLPKKHSREEIYPTIGLKYIDGIVRDFMVVMERGSQAFKHAFLAVSEIRPADLEAALSLQSDMKEGLETALLTDYPKVLAHVADLKDAQRGIAGGGRSKVYTKALQASKRARALHTGVEMYNRNLAGMKEVGQAMDDHKGPSYLDLSIAALLMNYGETHPEIVPIPDTSEEYSTDEHLPRGQHPTYSAEMIAANGLESSEEADGAVKYHNCPLVAAPESARLAAELCLAEMAEWHAFGPNKKDKEEVLAAMRRKVIEGKYRRGYAVAMKGDYDIEDFRQSPGIAVYEIAYRVISRLAGLQQPNAKKR